MITEMNAIREMYSMLRSEWNDTGISDIVGYTPELRREGYEPRSLPDTSKYWGRFSVRPTSDVQSTIKSTNDKRYRINGTMFVQIFGPKSSDESFGNIHQMAAIIKNVFRGHSTSDSIWFRDARIDVLNPEEKWYIINVVVRYQHDETRG